MLIALVESGAVALVAAAIIATEVVIVWLSGNPGRTAFAANGLAGILILAALGLALRGHGAVPILLALAGSFVAHLFWLLSARRG
ncbi:hypothetical protein [Aquibium microcysteis]|uniref:hypothetical protein n=1 Tax=Aquibium microcysteis TaxID=675281 RepID=UPI00165D075C|nr:hypothetical protein [Aquibium microcysteis]